MPLPTDELLSRRLRKEDVFDQLLAAILDGSLEPGERLRDGDLSSWLGVSRTPIRLALDRLEEMRLIESEPNRFTRVSPARPGRIPQTIEVMCGLWALAARRSIPRLDSEQAAECVSRLRHAAEACRQPNALSASEAVERMRAALFYFSTTADNALLCEMVVKIGADLRYQLGLKGADVDVASFAVVFDELAEAVAARDGDAAARTFARLRQSTATRPVPVIGFVS